MESMFRETCSVVKEEPKGRKDSKGLNEEELLSCTCRHPTWKWAMF